MSQAPNQSTDDEVKRWIAEHIQKSQPPVQEAPHVSLWLAMLSLLVLVAGFFVYAHGNPGTAGLLIVCAGFLCGISIQKPSRRKEPVLLGVITFMLLLCGGSTYYLFAVEANLGVLIIATLVGFSAGQLAGMRGVFTSAFSIRAGCLLGHRHGDSPKQ